MKIRPLAEAADDETIFRQPASTSPECIKKEYSMGEGQAATPKASIRCGLSKRSVLYLGTGDIGLPTLQALIESPLVQLVGVVTQPDRPIGRHQELVASSIKQLALKHQLLVLQPEKINAAESLVAIQALAPELIIVFAYGQILRKNLLTLPPYGCINLHASLLPRHRGAACIAATLLSGDPDAGITIMQMDEGLDTGAILLQQKLPLVPSETAASLQTQLAKLAAPLLLRALTLLQAGQLHPNPQDNALATYAPKLTKEDGQIDWTQSAEYIERLVRAMNPWPGAYTWLQDKSQEKASPKMLKIWSAQTTPDLSTDAPPGQIFQADAQGIWVATGAGALRITELQLEGKKRMNAADFLRGYPSELLFFTSLARKSA